MLKKSLTEKELIAQVDDYNIFDYYFGAIDLNKCYPSVFRVDIHPSTGFFINDEGRVVYSDLSTGEKYSSIVFVAKLYNINYYQAIEKIAKDFGIIEGVDNTPKAKVRRIKVKEKIQKNYEYTRGIWRPEELEYWNDYSISKEECEDNFIYPCREIKVNGVTVTNPRNYIKFMYVINGLDKKQYVKVYSPYDPIYKWVGHAPKDAIFGLTELPFKSKTLILTKGQKDRVIWKKLFTDVIAPQSENPNAIPVDVCEMINSNYDEIYVNYDCDEPGINGSKYYTEKYGWKWINVPNVYYKKEGIKDFADLVKAKGMDVFKKYLNWKGLITLS